MSGVNKVILLGRLGMDAELKVTQGGQSYANFSLATSETWKDKEGNKQEKTEWHRCTMWGDRAKNLAQYLTKGKMLYVEGSLETRTYEKDGEKRYATGVKVLNVQFAGDAKKSDGESAPARSNAHAPSSSDDFGDSAGGGDDDIPF